MKNLLKNGLNAIQNKVNQAGLAITGVLVGASAQAAVPTAASDAVTTITTDSAAFLDLLWVPIVAVTLFFMYVRFFKKGTKLVG